jgi:prevent-host-death family protein
MKAVAASDAKNRFDKLMDDAQRESVIIEKNGRPVAVLQSYEDYQNTERLKLRPLKQEITDSEQRMRLHRDQMPLCVIEWSKDYKVADWNPAAERVFGYTKEEAMGRHATELIIPGPISDQNEAGIFWRDISANDDEPRRIMENTTKNGQTRLCAWYNTLLLGADGKMIGMASLVDDITEHRQAEILSARMGRILAHSWNEIYAFDATSLHFVQVSDGACEDLGYSMDELKKLTPLELTPELTLEQFNALLDPLRRRDKPQITFESEHLRKDGSRYPVEVCLQLSSAETPPVFFAIIQDISERKDYIAELEHKALHDTLTDLPNRSLLHDRLELALKAAERKDEPVEVILVDVVRLKEVNDVLGHRYGDSVLQVVAARLQTILRESDTVARLGGDEFVIVLPAVDVEYAPLVARKIQEVFEQPFIIKDTPLEIEAAIGIAVYPDHGDEPAILLQHADIAMRVAKNEMTGFSIYDPEDDPYSLHRLKLFGELRRAINDKALILYYQPKIDIKSGRVTSAEALARWVHPIDGLIRPDDFIPLIERTGLIRPFTLCVLEQAICQCKQWAETDIDLTIAVNLSTRNLLDPSLPESITQLLETHQVNADRLTLEITESAVMSRPENAKKILTGLSEIGLKLSIDDFGTGYSSLVYLRQLPINELKIDHSFVSGITSSDNDAVIVRSTIDLAKNLGLNVVAEGVEDKDILDMLATFRCDIGQGYHFSRPLSAEEFSRWLVESPWGPGGTSREVSS